MLNRPSNPAGIFPFSKGVSLSEPCTTRSVSKSWPRRTTFSASGPLLLRAASFFESTQKAGVQALITEQAHWPQVVYNWINSNRRDSPVWQRGLIKVLISAWCPEVRPCMAQDLETVSCSLKAGCGTRSGAGFLALPTPAEASRTTVFPKKVKISSDIMEVETGTRLPLAGR